MSTTKEQEAWEAKQEELRISQNLPEGAVPEQRPIASQTVDDEALHSGVYKKLREAGDDRAGAPAMPFSAYSKAQSEDQAKKAAKESLGQERLFPGARGWVDNPGEPDNGRAIAVNGVHEWASPEAEVLASLGSPQAKYAVVKSYECVSRDGRAELLIVSAKHIRRDTSGGADWGKTPLNLP